LPSIGAKQRLDTCCLRFIARPWRRAGGLPTVHPIDKPTAHRKEPHMNHFYTTKPSSHTRQQAGAAALALCLTLGMLFSVNLLATQPASDAQMASSAASNPQVVSRAARAPQG